MDSNINGQKHYDGFLAVYGARVHNLKNIDVKIPRNRLTVITGISGSGKSSLAFDTIYAEGQRRYIESFSAYARQFIGGMERPDVDKITGLSPVISIEQKTTNRNPRSTVGTVTEIYDFLRLLYARIATAYSWNTSKEMQRFTPSRIIEHILENFNNKKVILLAPIIKGRKGHYRELFEKIRKQGYLRVRVDGEITEIKPYMQLDRYKIHDIEVVVDRLRVSDENADRLKNSMDDAFKLSKDNIMVMEMPEDDSSKSRAFLYSTKLMCPETGIAYEEPSPNTFSFNSPYGACPRCKGLGTIHQIDLSLIIPDPELSINAGGLAPVAEVKDNWLFRNLRKIASKYGFTLATPIKEIPPQALNVILFGNEEGEIDEADTASNYDYDKFNGIVHLLKRSWSETSSDKIRNWAESFMSTVPCPECEGTRLKKEARYFKINGKNIAEISQMDIRTLKQWIQQLPDKLNEKQRQIGQEVIKEILSRLDFLLDVGLDYLTLNRPARTLSGGESQRIRLATQIGSELTGITYILDEPSIGLHQRDNEKLIRSLQRLTHTGNTVIVVEHDRMIMESADNMVDLGPGAGEHGGEVVAAGSPGKILHANSLTAQYLSGKRQIPIPAQRRQGNGKMIKLIGASGNNLKTIDVAFPLGTMVCVTGVSGSGKSTLINETLYPVLRQRLYRSHQQPLPFRDITGLEWIDKVIEIDQSPIGRTPRSNPATYIGVFTDIRQLFAQLPESRIRGYKPGRFSFNVKGGRCEACQGAGVKVIEMNFLPDVYVECEKCLGRRFNRETLEIRYKNKSISDILDMTAEEAVVFFENIPKIKNTLQTMVDVGLGYVRLGQPATTLSGGEAQRVKLAAELKRKDTGKTLYILDEPTTGLHFEDILHLMHVLNKLVDRGNTVIIIEHNMDVIKMADYIIDLGPEGGDRGGQVIATGTPEEVAQNPVSYTGKYLQLELKSATITG